jgi:hypothetical protein
MYGPLEKEKVGPDDDPAFFRGMGLILVGRFDYCFLNFLLTLTRPISPDQNRIMVAGSMG